MNAKFDKQTRKKIIERDKGKCIICYRQGTDCHHVYFGTESVYGNDRNNMDQGVLLCRRHHEMVHGCKKGEGIRQECIDYLKTK